MYYGELENREYPGEIGNNSYTIFFWSGGWGYGGRGVNKVHYGLCENDKSCEHLSTLEIGAARLRFVTEIAPKSPFLCENGCPVQCGLRTNTKAMVWFKHSIGGELQGLVCY